MHLHSCFLPNLISAKLKLQTLFGIHLFDKATPSQNQIAFYISIILISLITYFVSGFTLWRVPPEESKAKVKELLRAMITKLRADRGLLGEPRGNLDRKSGIVSIEIGVLGCRLL
jgi:hypothetical protein